LGGETFAGKELPKRVVVIQRRQLSVDVQVHQIGNEHFPGFEWRHAQFALYGLEQTSKPHPYIGRTGPRAFGLSHDVAVAPRIFETFPLREGSAQNFAH